MAFAAPAAIAPAKPHGLDYARTLHGPDGEWRVGFDIRLDRGERGRITPKVMHDRVELDLPLTPRLLRPPRRVPGVP